MRQQSPHAVQVVLEASDVQRGAARMISHARFSTVDKQILQQLRENNNRT
jgi:hypothetical protein